MSKCSNIWVLIALLFVSLRYSNCQQDYADYDGGHGSSASLIFNKQTITSNPRESLSLECGVQGDFRSCFWEHDDSKQTLQVTDVHEGLERGMGQPEHTHGNECGIVINSVTEKTHGTWTCKVFVVGNTLRGSKDVIVTVKPHKPVLNVNQNPMVVLEGEEVEVACTVDAARPPPKFRWYIGAKDITSRSNSENIPINEEGTYRSVSILRNKFDHSDDRRNLRCSIEHYTLHEPEYSEVPMEIRHAPYSLSPSQIYGIPVEEEYEIRYNFTGNPLPELRWYTGDAEVPVPGEVGRYSSNIKKTTEKIYTATLRIRDFTQKDVGTIYRLTARNEFGEKEFDVSLSTESAPPDGAVGSVESPSDNYPFKAKDTFGTGTVIAIIIIILIILVLVLAILFMKYRQMYCFGQQDKVKDHMKNSGSALHEEHDTESSRESGQKASSAAIVFKNITSKFKYRTNQEATLNKAEEGEVKKTKSSKEKKDKKSKDENKDKKSKGESKDKKNVKDKIRKDRNGKEKRSKGDKTNGSKSEVVYAELEHSNQGEQRRGSNHEESTEYAEIVGTLPDNKEQESRE